jgi:hypothetical protein
VPDRERVFRAVKGIQHRYVAAVGDHARALTELAEAHGIDAVRLDRSEYPTLRRRLHPSQG